MTQAPPSRFGRSCPQLSNQNEDTGGLSHVHELSTKRNTLPPLSDATLRQILAEESTGSPTSPRSPRAPFNKPQAGSPRRAASISRRNTLSSINGSASAGKDSVMDSISPRPPQGKPGTPSSPSMTNVRESQGSRAANGRFPTMQRSFSRSSKADDDDDGRLSSQGQSTPRGSRSTRNLPSRQQNASAHHVLASPPGVGDDWDANQVRLASRGSSRSSTSLPSRQQNTSIQKLVPINSGVMDPDKKQLQPQEKSGKQGGRSLALQALLSPRTPADKATRANAATNSPSPADFIATQWKKLKGGKQPPRKQPSVLKFIRIGKGQIVHVKDVLRLKTIFEDLSPDEEGLVPISCLSDIIVGSIIVNDGRDSSGNTKAKIAHMNKICGQRKNQYGQTSFDFHGLLRLNFPGITAQDIATIENEMHKTREKNDLKSLGKDAASQAREVFDLHMDPDNTGCATGVDYDTLLRGLQETFPDSSNIHKVLKSIDQIIFQRLLEGGEMTKNEFVLWYAKELNEKTQIWTPNDNSILEQKSNSGMVKKRNRSRRMTPSSILSGYLSSFASTQRQI